MYFSCFGPFWVWGVTLFFPFCTSLDTLTPDQFIKDDQSLVSKGNNFALGFFSPSNSSYQYLGIWFVKVTKQTVVWVANRNDPINDSSGVLSINQFGNLVLHDSFDRLLWSTNVSVQGTTSCVAQLQDSGNLVLIQGNNKKVLWQSFDYPTDTLLPGMRLGLNRITGLDRFLTSWKSQDDPGTGDCIYKMNPNGSPQAFLYKGSILYRSAAWPWQTLSASARVSSGYKYDFVNKEDEVSFAYFVEDLSIIVRVVIENSGLLRNFMWNDRDLQWKELWSAPKYRCDNYGHCGAYSKCGQEYPDKYNGFECTCLPGYEPKSPKGWYLRDGSEGCVKKNLGLSMCGNGEGFVKLESVKGPDSSNAAWMETSMSSSECQQACLSNCSCTAFISMDIEGKGTRCLAWYGELTDILENSIEWKDLNIRVDATELATYTRKSKGFPGNKKQLVTKILSFTVPLILVSLIAYMWLMKKKKNKRTVKRKLHNQSFNFTSTKGSLEVYELEGSSRNPHLSIFSLSSIVAATDNFSPTNKLGQGGFGPVFKGQLSDGQQIAVKRLSKSSGQGIEEFKNEVVLITKLQHRNLVKIFGCCIEEEEKMLIYDYMPNKSLDTFIFDPTRSSLLNWSKRFEIIIGIARGILYLHQDSRLRIIHRDLKTSNVLLDGEMNPKISDFGMARIFKGDQTQDKTTRVVGTYGYMSPEYAVFGKFSTKSDVFSFGVILLEIVSGKKNNGYYTKHASLTLIGHVWELWKEERALDIVDSSINESFVSHEVLKCIQIGLLCVQEEATDRPTMLAVLLMLSCETTLPSPKQPAFIFKRPTNDLGSITGGGFYSINDVTITEFEAR